MTEFWLTDEGALPATALRPARRCWRPVPA